MRQRRPAGAELISVAGKRPDVRCVQSLSVVPLPVSRESERVTLDGVEALVERLQELATKV